MVPGALATVTPCLAASPERGRFRDFLKVSLRNLVMDHFRKKKVRDDKIIHPSTNASWEPGDESQQEAQDEAFVSSFREEVLARTWEALADAERTSGKPHHTVLRFKIQHATVECLGVPLADNHHVRRRHPSPPGGRDLQLELQFSAQSALRSLTASDPAPAQALQAARIRTSEVPWLLMSS